MTKSPSYCIEVAKVNIQNSKRYSPFCAALENDDKISISKCPVQLLLQYGAYSDLNVKVATQRRLEGYWNKTFRHQKEYQSFYTTLLLAGVVVPPDVVLPESLQTIRRHIQETVSTWLKPLIFSPEDCADCGPKALILLPCLGTAATHTLTDLLLGTDFFIKETDNWSSTSQTADVSILKTIKPFMREFLDTTGLLARIHRQGNLRLLL